MFVCFFVLFAFFLGLSLFNRSQMVNFKEKYHFSRFRRGTNFSRGGGGGGGVRLFPGGGWGGPLLIPYRNTYNLWFSRGVRTPCPPSGSALGCDLISFPVRKMMRSPLAPVLVFLQLHMYSVEPRNKIDSWTYCITVAWFIQHLLQFVFAFFNHSIMLLLYICERHYICCQSPPCAVFSSVKCSKYLYSILLWVRMRGLKFYWKRLVHWINLRSAPTSSKLPSLLISSMLPDKTLKSIMLQFMPSLDRTSSTDSSSSFLSSSYLSQSKR